MLQVWVPNSLLKRCKRRHEDSAKHKNTNVFGGCAQRNTTYPLTRTVRMLITICWMPSAIRYICCAIALSLINVHIPSREYHTIHCGVILYLVIDTLTPGRFGLQHTDYLCSLTIITMSLVIHWYNRYMLIDKSYHIFNFSCICCRTSISSISPILTYSPLCTCLSTSHLQVLGIGVIVYAKWKAKIQWFAYLWSVTFNLVHMYI